MAKEEENENKKEVVGSILRYTNTKGETARRRPASKQASKRKNSDGKRTRRIPEMFVAKCLNVTFLDCFKRDKKLNRKDLGKNSSGCKNLKT